MVEALGQLEHGRVALGAHGGEDLRDALMDGGIHRGGRAVERAHHALDPDRARVTADHAAAPYRRGGFWRIDSIELTRACAS